MEDVKIKTTLKGYCIILGSCEWDARFYNESHIHGLTKDQCLYLLEILQTYFHQHSNNRAFNEDEIEDYNQ